MSTLIGRGAVLTLSRVSNFAILMISPLILVRILPAEDFGRYQEFLLYAMLAMALAEFHIDSSLTFFIPKNPARERSIATHTSVLVLALSTIVISLLMVLRPFLLQFTSYDFLDPLAAYIFCYVNLNWLEYYWVAKGRTDRVLIYTAGRLVLRVSVLLVVAYLTRDITLMLWAIVGAEATRLALVAVYLCRAGIFTREWGVGDIKAQLKFASPLGASGFVQSAGRNAGKLFIGSALGPTALAQYAVGSYLIPVVKLIRGSISAVVFPELVRRRQEPAEALKLWRRTNVVYCVLLFPAFTVMCFHGELIITTLFTAAYLPALPVFYVYMLLLLRGCFNMDVLLRSNGRTGFVFIGSVLALAANLFLMVVLYRQVGFVGPAIASILSEILLELYYVSRVGRDLKVSRMALIDWKSIGSVATGCVAGLPILIVMRVLPGWELMWAVMSSIAFVSVCWWVAYRLGVRDIEKIVVFAVQSVRRLVPG